MTCRFAASLLVLNGAGTIYATISMNKTLQHSFVFLGSFSNLSVNHLSAVVMSLPVLIMVSARSRSSVAAGILVVSCYSICVCRVWYVLAGCVYDDPPDHCLSWDLKRKMWWLVPIKPLG